MPPRRDIYSSFADPNSFLGQPFFPRVGQALTSGASAVGSAISQGVENVGRLASSVGSALTFPIAAAREAVSGTPLVGGPALGRANQQQPAIPSFPNLPSGTVGSYQTSQLATPTMPTTQRSQFAASNPRPATADDVDAFLRRGAYAPQQPTAQAAQAPARTTIQTPYGTISATPEQVANMNRQRTASEQSSRSPAEQQALLAQVRANGARLAAQQTETMRNFAESRGPRFAPAAAPQGRFGQPLTNLFPQSTEAIAQRTERNAPFLAATGFGEMQRSIGQAEPLRGPLAQTSSIFANRSPFTQRFIGPQSSQSMMASNNIFGRSPFSLI